MTARATILLLALILLVGGYLWWEQSVPQAPHAPPASARGGPAAGPTQVVQRFFELHADEVVRVQLQRDGETREAVCAGTGWPAAAIGDFLEVLTEIGVVMDISGDSDRAQEYGLRPPRSVATLYRAGGAVPLVLRIGDRNPSTTGVYVQVGSEGQIALAGALVDWEFEKAFRALGTTSAPPAQ